jgi:hypothetical protein
MLGRLRARHGKHLVMDFTTMQAQVPQSVVTMVWVFIHPLFRWSPVIFTVRRELTMAFLAPSEQSLTAFARLQLAVMVYTGSCTHAPAQLSRVIQDHPGLEPLELFDPPPVQRIVAVIFQQPRGGGPLRAYVHLLMSYITLEIPHEVQYCIQVSLRHTIPLY